MRHGHGKRSVMRSALGSGLADLRPVHARFGLVLTFCIHALCLDRASFYSRLFFTETRQKEMPIRVSNHPSHNPEMLCDVFISQTGLVKLRVHSVDARAGCLGDAETQGLEHVSGQPSLQHHSARRIFRAYPCANLMGLQDT